MGAICRDNTPHVHFAAAGPLSLISDAMHVETLALSNAIQTAEQLGIGRVLFETDYINLQHAMTIESYDYGPLGALLTDMKFRLHMNFIEANVVYAPRVCNWPAHELAAMGVEVAHGETEFWMVSYPDIVNHLVTGIEYSRSKKSIHDSIIQKENSTKTIYFTSLQYHRKRSARKYKRKELKKKEMPMKHILNMLISELKCCLKN
jgi:hypothetical protein